MPLDGHAYLVSQGWAGKGTGLRQGAMVRPLAIPQKRTLAGLGKDRDEAFPFWDHLFAAAANSIKVKVHNDDSDDSGSNSDKDDVANATSITYSRTSTGILSNKRPTTGISASTGTSTPSDDASSSTQSFGPKLSLLAMAKRQAAKQRLYAGFYRGPLLGPDGPTEAVAMTEDVVGSASSLDPMDEGIDSGNSRRQKKKTKSHDTNVKEDVSISSTGTKVDKKIKTQKGKEKADKLLLHPEESSVAKKKKRKHENNSEYPEGDAKTDSKRKKSRRNRDIPTEMDHREDGDKRKKKSRRQSCSITSEHAQGRGKSQEGNVDSGIASSVSAEDELARKIKRKWKEEKRKATNSKIS